ncbi:MAG: phage holin family protein [Spirulinaceae cyanobacterium RM2_2_10]|nr:phage holin family protein [Spirulinaceae cyanobacterium SM2_1_0]NJO19154.1 phage holin family protein [Spirulinaceae cyanobacterium RM2_2_10]
MVAGLLAFLITVLITAITLVIISWLPFGIEVNSFGKALTAGLVLGLLNAFVRPVVLFFGFPITILTLGLFWVAVNIVMFGLAAWLVEGVRLRWGVWSAILGAIALSIMNSILHEVFTRLFPTLLT